MESVISAALFGALVGGALGFLFSLVIESVLGKTVNARTRNTLILVCTVIGYAVVRTFIFPASDAASTREFTPSPQTAAEQRADFSKETGLPKLEPSGYQRGDNWFLLRSNVGRFQVRMPREPKLEHDDGEVNRTGVFYEMDSYTADDPAGRYYTAAIVMYSKNMVRLEPSEHLAGAIEGVVLSDEGNRLVSSRPATVAGREAAHYVIMHPQWEMHGLVVFDDRQLYLYQLLIASEPGAFNQKSYERFVNSLEFF